MRKTILLASVAAAALFSSCGVGTLGQATSGTTTTQTTGSSSSSGVLGNILGQVGGLSGIGDILSGALGITTNNIVGTWVYQGPAVVFESDNILTKAGGKLAAQALASKLDTYYQKVGLTPGKMTMTFDNSGNFQQTFSDKAQTGTYSLADGNVTMTYSSGVQQFIGTTQFDGNNLVIVVDMTKLLNLAKSVTAGSNSSALGSISSIASTVNGMKAGLKFTKQ